MPKILLLTSELQRPVGGLYRYVVELLPAWRKNFNEGRTTFEPLVWSLYDPSLGLNDLKPCDEFTDLVKGTKVYEALRGGERCLFLESSLSEDERNAFHRELWEKWRIKSEKAAYWDYYQKLNAWWRHMPLIAEQLSKHFDIYAIDAQDWLAFPAGFLCRERIKKPLLCRFHSGEHGRSLGVVDYDAPPVRIEAAAFMEADYVQGVSISEAKFEIYSLLGLKQAIVRDLAPMRSQRWLEEQAWRDSQFEEFVLLEAMEPELITQLVAGIPNGIYLEPWKSITRQTIERGREMLQKLLPGRKKYVFFAGRSEWRKGIDHLIEAFAALRNPDYGLLIVSRMDADTYRKYTRKIAELGIENQTLIYNAWIDEEDKHALFCASDVIALPSLYEPFGLVTLEGLAAALACEMNDCIGPVTVVGDTGGMHELITNGVNGFKAPMEEDRFEMNPQFLAKVLQIALTDERLRKRISMGAAERIQSKHFDWRYISLQICELYRKAAENYSRWRTS